MQFLRDFLNDGPKRIEARDKWVGENVMPFVPPELRQWLTVGDAINPVSDIRRAGEKARVVANPDRTTPERIGALGDVLVDSASVLAPAAAAKYSGKAAQGVVDALAMASMPADDAAQRFVADQSGAIKAWHSSPHDFDKFSLDKIGTGEGAQAYGHGLYFAESPEVSGVGGQYWRDFIGRVPVSDELNAALADAYNLGYSGPKAARAAILSDPQWRDAYDLSSDVADRIERAMPSSSPRTYEVNIDANPEDFLDWDAPLSAQPEGVREWALDNMQARGWQGDNVPLREIWNQWAQDGLDPSGIAELPRRGEDIYRAATNDARGLSIAVGDSASTALTPAQAAASNELFQGAGIPGIRYLDQGSRGAGDGSRNYVVFDDSLVSILNKYGLAGLGLGTTTVGAALSGQPAQAQDTRLKDYLNQ